MKRCKFIPTISTLKICSIFPHCLRGLSPSLYAVIYLCLSACSMTMSNDKIASLSPAWIQHHNQVAAIGRWNMQGVVNLRYRERRWNFNIRWECTHQSSVLDLYTVRGDKLMEFEVTPQQARAKDRRGQSYSEPNGEALALKLLGVRMPIDSLCQWLIGIPDAGGVKPQFELDDQGRLASLIQFGWHIGYQDYRDASNSLSLPGKLILRKGNIQIIVFATQHQLI